jgi:hypothetical protein
MTEQETVTLKFDLLPYHIGDPLPEVDFGTEHNGNPLFLTAEGLRQQVEEQKKWKPDSQDMKLAVIRHLTDEEKRNPSKSRPLNDEEKALIVEKLNSIRADKTKETLNG